ncbi:MAG TPA: bifunctional demethylmenaquinone methyltransferase/2-methoxy-6-polyprenyl-1,4-benzoquinol methylase UbiE [Pyrinomonadaceae bacterium]|nr:bifunctional demethylmenaquinone methyltransferase/2-methoxy-6-polyprenyl-1,4-benzoquinol methylase UbiE [Pyrinomonadaceae bacterium]
MSVTRLHPDEDSRDDHARRVRQMFARIAGRYDLLNHLLSGNTDRRWRRLVARELADALTPGARVLDVACGTGDLALTLAAAGRVEVVGVDFCRPMLEVAARKSAADSPQVTYVEGDALRLPFAAEAFDVATIAFGLRNLSSVEGGLRELRRVLRPGGRLAVLEFSRPVVPGFRALFQFYFTRVLPRVGGLLSGSRGAYEYLPDSVSRFPNQRRLAELMSAAGFECVAYKNLTGGIAALHTGRVPALSSTESSLVAKQHKAAT